MSIFKCLSAATLTAISMSLGAINFDLANSDPKDPIYYKINNDQKWQELKQGHVSATVPNVKWVKLALAATSDGKGPITHFVFCPEPKGINIDLTLFPLTCFIDAHIDHSKQSKHVEITPQNAVPNTKKTRSRLSLTNNITFALIKEFEKLAAGNSKLDIEENISRTVELSEK